METLKALQALGFYRYERAISELCRKAEGMAAAAGELMQSDRFEAFPSFIPADPPELRHPVLLSLQIGAAAARAAVRLVEGEDRQRWKMLFQLPHADLLPADRKQQNFDFFAGLLARRAVEALAGLGLRKKDVTAGGTVWSNPLENRPMDGRGITGLIAYRAVYRKGEWFLASAKDGFDAGKALLGAFDRAGLHLKKFVICNDTPLTMKALTFADGGMVVSHGLNGTLVKRLARIMPGGSQVRVICNAEMGARWELPEGLTTRADLIDDRKIAESMEALCAGAFLPRLFAQYVITLEHQGCTQFAPLSRHLFELGPARWRAFDASDLSALLYDKAAFQTRRDRPDLFTSEVLLELEDLARALIIRSAKLCAVVAYATVSEQLAEKDGCLVALDSSLAREMPLFLTVLRDTLLETAPPRRSVELRLLEPLAVQGGEISPPMLGAAHAVDNLLSPAV